MISTYLPTSWFVGLKKIKLGTKLNTCKYLHYVHLHMKLEICVVLLSQATQVLDMQVFRRTELWSMNCVPK